MPPNEIVAGRWELKEEVAYLDDEGVWRCSRCHKPCSPHFGHRECPDE